MLENRENRHPLLVAALTDDVQTVVSLLRRPDAQPLLRGPLPSSCYCGDDHGVGDKTTLLHAVCEAGALRVAQLLAREAPGLLRMRTRSGFTPLLVCCTHLRETHCEGLTMLIKGSALDNVRRKSDGWGPLHLCAHAGCAACCQLLLTRAPGLIDARDKAGRTALHCAAACTDGLRGCECVTLLLSNGAEVDASTALYERPIHTASRAAAAESVALLMHARADATERTGRGYGCLALALAAAADRAGRVGRATPGRRCGDGDGRSDATGLDGEGGEAECGACGEREECSDLVETLATLIEAGAPVSASELRALRLGADLPPRSRESSFRQSGGEEGCRVSAQPPSLRRLSERAIASQLGPENLVAALQLAEAVGAPELQGEAERMFVQQFAELDGEGAFEREQTGPGFHGGGALLRQILSRCLEGAAAEPRRGDEPPP